jgi:hypothetical protein
VPATTTTTRTPRTTTETRPPRTTPTPPTTASSGTGSPTS